VTGLSWDLIRKALGDRPPQPISSCQGRAAVAILLRDGDAGIEVLFIHRAEHPDDPWSGHMAFPGGRAEAGEPPLATAIRESAEEIGVHLHERDLLGALDELQAVRRVPLDLAIAPFVFRAPNGADLRLGDEVDSVCWIPMGALLDGRYRSTFDYEEGGSTLRFPCFRVDDKVIWGLTYRMFSELAMRLRTAAG